MGIEIIKKRQRLRGERIFVFQEILPITMTKTMVKKNQQCTLDGIVSAAIFQA
jgi:hypothetical protein